MEDSERLPTATIEVPGVDSPTVDVKGHQLEVGMGAEEDLTSPLATPRDLGDSASPADASARKKKSLLSKLKSSLKRKDSAGKKGARAAREAATSPDAADVSAGDLASPRGGEDPPSSPPPGAAAATGSGSKSRSSWRRRSLSRTKSGGSTAELPTPRRLGVDEDAEAEEAEGGKDTAAAKAEVEAAEVVGEDAADAKPQEEKGEEEEKGDAAAAEAAEGSEQRGEDAADADAAAADGGKEEDEEKEAAAAGAAAGVTGFPVDVAEDAEEDEDAGAEKDGVARASDDTAAEAAAEDEAAVTPGGVGAIAGDEDAADDEFASAESSPPAPASEAGAPADDAPATAAAEEDEVEDGSSPADEEEAVVEEEEEEEEVGTSSRGVVTAGAAAAAAVGAGAAAAAASGSGRASEEEEKDNEEPAVPRALRAPAPPRLDIAAGDTTTSDNDGSGSSITPAAAATATTPLPDGPVSCPSPALTPAQARQAKRLAARVSALGRDMGSGLDAVPGPVLLRITVCDNPRCPTLAASSSSAAGGGGGGGIAPGSARCRSLSGAGLLPGAEGATPPASARRLSMGGEGDPVASHLSSALKQAAEMERVIRASLDMDNAVGADQKSLRHELEAIAESAPPSARGLPSAAAAAKDADSSLSSAAFQPVVLRITVVEDVAAIAAEKEETAREITSAREREARAEDAAAASAAAAAAAAAEVTILTKQFTAQRDAFAAKDRELRNLVSRLQQERGEAQRQQGLLETSRDDMARLQGQLKGRIAKLEGVVASGEKRVKVQASEIEELRSSVARLTGELAAAHSQLDSTPDRCKVANHQLQEQAEWAHRKAREHERRVRKLERLLEREWCDHDELLLFLSDELDVMRAVEAELSAQIDAAHESRSSHALQLSEEREKRVEVDMALKAREQELKSLQSEAARASGGLAERDARVAELNATVEKQAKELEQAAANVRGAEAEVDLINQSNEQMFRYINYVRGQLQQHAKELEKGSPQIAHLSRELSAWCDKEATERAKTAAAGGSGGGSGAHRTSVTAVPAAATKPERGGFFKAPASKLRSVISGKDHHHH